MICYKIHVYNILEKQFEKILHFSTVLTASPLRVVVVVVTFLDRSDMYNV